MFVLANTCIQNKVCILLHFEMQPIHVGFYKICKEIGEIGLVGIVCGVIPGVLVKK